MLPLPINMYRLFLTSGYVGPGVCAEIFFKRTRSDRMSPCGRILRLSATPIALLDVANFCSGRVEDRRPPDAVTTPTARLHSMEKSRPQITMCVHLMRSHCSGALAAPHCTLLILHQGDTGDKPLHPRIEASSYLHVTLSSI